MKQYVTFKIKKIYIYILLFVLVITLCGFGYYKSVSYTHLRAHET